MRKIILFMMISADGYFEGLNHELVWHHTDEEFNQFAVDQLTLSDTLLFGRVTFEMMASYWPLPMAKEQNPGGVPDLMNNTAKIVVSKTLEKVEWKNSSVLKNVQDLAAIKQSDGKDILLLGSSKLAVSLLEQGLLDEMRLMVNPVVLGEGHAVFNGLDRERDLRLMNTRTFKNGNVLLSYIPTDQ